MECFDSLKFGAVKHTSKQHNSTAVAVHNWLTPISKVDAISPHSYELGP
jgi:hypothetical protein